MPESKSCVVDISSTSSSPYLDFGILASRMCLVLDRYIEIEDYRIPGEELFQQAIKFFSDAQKGVTSSSIPTDAPRQLELVANVLKRMKGEEGITGNDVQKFCDTSITTLKLLVTNRAKVTRRDIEELNTFFTSLERAITKEIPNLSNIV